MQSAESRRRNTPSRTRCASASARRVTHHASRTRCDGATARRVTHHSQRAVALVITLLLLSVITFMAVTFLVVSRSQHGSVTTETDQAVARLATDTARDRAIAQLVAPMLAMNSEFDYGLLVSTNYINPGGFISGVSSPLNVCYNYDTGNPLSLADSLQNLTNLLYDPRPPVFITNALFANSNDFRFYLDLNRNGRDDPNGLQPVINPQGGFYDLSGKEIDQISPGNTLSNYFVGDPEWIGVLKYPEYGCSADNPFVSRYAYIAVPVGQTLDINYIYNQALRPTKRALDPLGQDFLRDQGVGTYEINLAAFLCDLNTNVWGGGYRYDPINGFPPAGTAFADAEALLAYRYAMNPVSGQFTLASVSTLFPNGVNAFRNDYIDAYSTGLMLGSSGFSVDPDNSPINCTAYPWAGADNPNHFDTTQDFFDRSKTSRGVAPKTPSFTDRLMYAGTNNSSYDRDTFYRLLSQLGTDSAPEPGGKMNVNYCNVDQNGYVVPDMATNFIPWQPAQFFTNAAVRLLADAGFTVGNGLSATNLLVRNVLNGILVTNLHIPIWPTNYYTPSVHRLLQLAANLYDATTNRVFTAPPDYPYLPTVFRPVFSSVGGGRSGQQIAIVDYMEVTNNAHQFLNDDQVLDLSNPNQRQQVRLYDYSHMIDNIPLVIGAKKGLPNFNKFAMQTLVQVTRKLQFLRYNGQNNGAIVQTNQMYLVGISNSFAVEAWNSYLTNFPRDLQVYAYPDVSVVMTNEMGKVLMATNIPSFGFRPMAANTWSGYNPNYESYSFVVPLDTNVLFMTNSTYRYASSQFVPANGTFEKTSPTYYVPHWWLNLKCRLRFAIVDKNANRFVDYVNLSDQNSVNLTGELTQGGNCGTSYSMDGNYGSLWCTNHYPVQSDASLPTYGVLNQVNVSLGQQPAFNEADWNSAANEFPAGMDKEAAIDFFRAQYGLGPLYTHSPNIVFSKTNTFAAPYQPIRNIYLVTSWQANDPLVHYTAGDLSDPTQPSVVLDQFSTPPGPPVSNLRKVNRRYEPWGGNPSGIGASGAPACDLTVKDPLMLRSDYWDFPTNKFPNIGWLGRVHRGSPWQTIYLKSFSNINWSNWFVGEWQKWTGDRQILTNVGQIATSIVPLAVPGRLDGLAADAYFTQPTNDWHLLDLFTTALNDNATRGQLSINQSGLAAWSAVLSGVLVLSNKTDASGNLTIVPQVIQPAGVFDSYDPATWPPLVRLVKRINDVRATNSVNHAFNSLGDILAVPELTVASPFLNLNGTPSLFNNGLNDQIYERIPQQILGLLKCDHTPRFAIYAFGQTLKPAPHSIVPSGTYAGLCTNYQIVAESATRTVVRLDGFKPYPAGGPPPPIRSFHPVIESFSVLPPD